MVFKWLVTAQCLLLLSPSLAQNTTSDVTQTDVYPSEELLEFLAEFGTIDEDTYELIEYHALQDSEANRQEISDEQ